MKTFRVPVVWTMMGHYEIKAENEEEAIEKAKDPDLPLPENGSYLTDSFEVDGEGIMKI